MDEELREKCIKFLKRMYKTYEEDELDTALLVAKIDIRNEEEL